ncbi:MAG: hypothetical protein ONB46_16980 [candidate division KSB1 bacterium]|nr:hypothetical protein [candidate division KSB1 bacterium]MDZ7367472.1 hypothetical protein [candidate division KSB1 bacterium]MDZ7405423.1 hypothetical protein [candidate division KSB1 bacterium]
MIGWIFIIVSLPLFALLWRLAEKCPQLLARISHRLQKQHEPGVWFEWLFVFSAATTQNREAEFIDNRPLQSRKLIRLLRALLVISYFLFAVYMLRKL